MPLFVFHGLDRSEGGDIRARTRPAHLDWIASLAPRIRIAGPMLAEDGVTPVGSLVALEAADLSDACATFARDPYAEAGLWASAQVRAFNWIVGRPD
ncbi:MAG: YciI family protein [Alphaproteobacteria bacterium]|nr:YciI family protein [Alphaproteobacteria bacterium]